MVSPESSADLPPCSVAIKCADDPSILRCIESIDDPDVSVNAVLTPNDRIEGMMRERGIPYVVTPYGNIAKSADLSVRTAEHDNVIIADSDVRFAPGAIGLLRAALVDAPVVKPRLRFEDTGSHLSKVVAASRERYNAVPGKATNPGLGIRRAEVAERCGGLVFNPAIRWTEDADLNYRLQKNDVPVRYVPEAEIWHGPVGLKHELRCAFLYGVGKRLSVENNPDRPAKEELLLVARSLASVSTLRDAVQKVTDYGVDGALLASVWRTLYLTGYHAQKLTQHWTLDKAA